MEDKECRFDYNEIDDSLVVSCKEQNENVKERFTMGNFIFNLTGRGKIVGIQILNVSEVLTDYNLNPDILDNKLKSVHLIIAKKDGLLGVALILIGQNQQGKISIPLMNMSQTIR